MIRGTNTPRNRAVTSCSSFTQQLFLRFSGHNKPESELYVYWVELALRAPTAALVRFLDAHKRQVFRRNGWAFTLMFPKRLYTLFTNEGNARKVARSPPDPMTPDRYAVWKSKKKIDAANQFKISGAF